MVTELGIVTVVTPAQFLNIPSGIWVNPFSKVTDVRFVVPVNTPPTFEGPFTNVFGIVIVVSLGQFLNTSKLIFSNCPKLTLAKLLHPLNAPYPISCIEFETVTPVILVADLKASLPIDITVFSSKVDGIVTFPVNSDAFVHFKFSIWFESFNSYSQFAVTPLIVDVAVYLSFANTFPLNPTNNKKFL